MLIVYESMYGNTRRIAEAVADELHGRAVPVTSDEAAVGDGEPVVLGAPTHVWHLSSARTRRAAADGAAKAGSGLVLEPDADGRGMRDWLQSLTTRPHILAAFDTRFRGPRWATGSAARQLARLCARRHGAFVVPPESFLVEKTNVLVAGEELRARAWADRVAAAAGLAAGT
ncbi:MAG: flavodoxin domain-containing protein [Jatrophihabitans sp.]|uniref:flavodoxin domain-containing protein n=1 Tax=Jatrophihabitans sp. TaxID=1932789 RepID=UPI003F7F3050